MTITSFLCASPLPTGDMGGRDFCSCRELFERTRRMMRPLRSIVENNSRLFDESQPQREGRHRTIRHGSIVFDHCVFLLSDLTQNRCVQNVSSVQHL